ncbi:MAG: hypothetical protein P8R42_24085 [Candidatus Binatia bacterium]|nr:hypothetical protein [Candidatus Binatia bacterium]
MLTPEQGDRICDLCGDLSTLVTAGAPEIDAACDTAVSAAQAAESREAAATEFRRIMDGHLHTWCWDTLGDEVFDPPEQGNNGLPIDRVDDLTRQVSVVAERILDLVLQDAG